MRGSENQGFRWIGLEGLVPEHVLFPVIPFKVLSNEDVALGNTTRDDLGSIGC